MGAQEKFCDLKTWFFHFIDGVNGELLDSPEFSKRPDAKSIHDIKTLKAFSQEILNSIKKKKETTQIEKSKVSIQMMNQLSNNSLSASYEISNTIRTITQKKISHFELSYNDSVNEFSKPVIGRLWIESNDWVNQINEISILESHRSHETILTLKEQTTNDILNKLKKRFTDFAKNDVSFLNDRIKTAQEEVKTCLHSYDIKDYIMTDINLDFEKKYNDIIRSCIRIDNPYQGSYAKKNFRSLIFEMRSFSMMFLLLLSSFGINHYIAQNEKSRMIVYMISLVLIVIGILVTFANAQDSKEERLEDEIKKAKEKMNSEIKRSVNEFILEWRGFINSSFKTAISDISLETERLIKEDTKRKNDNIVTERLKLNQLSQMLDAKDRNYQDILRKCENWQQQIDTLAFEIEKLPITVNN